MELGENDVTHLIRISQNPDAWTWSKTNADFFCLRMSIIRLNDGSLLVVSPIPNLDKQTLLKINTHGPVSLVLAPNHFHNLGLNSFLNRYPDARCIASSSAIPRLRKKTGLSFQAWSDFEKLLPSGVSLVEPEGLKGGEIWIEIAGEEPKRQILIVCDAFFNMNKAKSFTTNLLMRITGTIPGLKVSRVFRLFMISNRRLYKYWVYRRWKVVHPELLIPAHGDYYWSRTLSDELLDLI